MSTLSSAPDEQHYENISQPQSATEVADNETGQKAETARPPLWLGALVGAAAGLVSSGIMLWIGREWGGAILPQLISERVTDILPLSAVRRGLQDLEENAKPAALGGITMAQIAVGAIIGLGYCLVARRDFRARVLGGLSVAIIVWLFLSLVAAPLGDVGLFARDANQGFWETQVLFLISSGIFGLIIATFLPWPMTDSQPQQEMSTTDATQVDTVVTAASESAVLNADASADSEVIAEPTSAGGALVPVNPSRRTVLKVAGVGVLAVPAIISAAYIGQHMNRLRTVYTPELAKRTVDGDSIFATAGMPEEITPTDAFYVVSKNLVDPTVDAGSWSLKIDGLVDKPMTLSYTDILRRDSVEFISTLECISNRVGGGFISTAVWAGFPLRDLLDEARIQAGVIDIELHAEDGYVESIPLAEALAEDTMVVHSMNGEPLNDKHGYPLRLIVPGIFGMKNVKWLSGIKPVGDDIQGFWQQRDWSDVATVVTMSRFDIPKSGYRAPLGETVRLGGVAFSGDREISSVEVTTDGGETWQEAQLSDPLSNLAWRLWIYEHTAAEPGLQRLAVRATDGNGDQQTEEANESLPDGATGWHRRWYEVLDANGESVPFNGKPASNAGESWVRTGRDTSEGDSDRD